MGAMFFSAAGFVLTFDNPTSPDAAGSDDLAARGGGALGTFYDKPLDDPRYGDNTMSKRLAESMSGNTGPLSTQLNDTMPRETLSNLYINNGYATQPVYEVYDTTGLPTTSTSRLIQPQWSYVWTSTDFQKYPADPTTTPTKMGLYTLPVSDGTVVDGDGAEVDVIIEGEQDSDQHKTSNFRLDTSFTVRQADSNDDPIPHASLYFNDSNDDPEGYRDITAEIGGSSNTTWYNVTLEETEGEAVDSGSQVTVTLPRGWTANATDESGDYTVVETKTDESVRGDLVFELDRDVQDEALNLGFNATYEQDEYEFYTFRASLDEPDLGDARIVVRAEDQTGYTGGDFPHPRISAPRSMGTWTNGTWVVSFPNPENVVDSNELKVDTITVEAPLGKDLFEEVRTVVSPDQACGSPGWTVKSPSKMVWDPDPSNCQVSTGDGFDLGFEVRGNSSYSTDKNLTEPFHPDSEFDNGHNVSVDRAFVDGFPRQFVPPDTQGLSGVEEYPGYPHDDSHSVDTDSVYGTNLLMGDTDYGAKSVDTFQSALALGSVTASDPQPVIGGSTTIDIEVESLLLALSEKGMEANVETNIYPPWDVGNKNPIETVDHVEENILDASIEWLFVEELDGDGEGDLVAITPQTKLYGIDGSSGTQISGLQVNRPDFTATAAVEYDYDASTTGYAIGFEDGSVRVYDANFDRKWTRNVTNDAIEAINASYDWDGDGVTDIVVGSTEKVVFVDGEGNSESRLWRAPGTAHNVIGVDLVEESPSDDAETAASLGAEAEVEAFGVTFNGDKQTYDDDQNRLDEYIEDGDTDAALQDAEIYARKRAVKAWDTNEDVVWQGAYSGFLDLAGGDIDDNGIDDVVGGQASENPYTTDGDPGRVQAHNGSLEATDKVATAIAYGSNIIDMSAPTQRHANTISQDGILMYTKDGWTNRMYYGWDPASGSLDVFQFPNARTIDFVNASEGWIAGDANSMHHTVNGNDDWEEVDYTVQLSDGTEIDLSDTTYRYLDMEWRGPDHGIAVGGDCTAAVTACEWGLILYTRDGGETWTDAGAPEEVNLDGFSYNDAFFVNDTIAYAAANDARVVKSTDGGESWSLVSPDKWSTLDFRPDFETIYFHNATHGYVAGEDGAIYRTTDGGSNWESVTILQFPHGADDVRFHDMDFATEDKGYLVGADGAFYVTVDGGQRWVADAPPGPDDTVSGLEYRTVEVPREGTGWAGGKTDDSASDRMLVYLPSHDDKSKAVSNTLSEISTWHDDNGDGLSEVRSARVHPDHFNADDTNITYHLSNDGCDNWVEIPKNDPREINAFGKAEYEWTDFSDSSQTDLCFKAVFEAGTRFEYRFFSPWLVNLTIEYEYKESGDSEWSTRNHSLDLTDTSQVNASATTARWDTENGTIANGYIDTFWTQRTEGQVNEVLMADLTGDGEDDVLVRTGRKATSLTGYDNRIYAFDGTTGELLHNTSKLPGKPEAMTVVDLSSETGDSIQDIVVNYENDVTGTPNIRAYDGDTFDLIWNQTDNGTVASWAYGNIDGDAADELTRGTEALYATEQPVMTAHEPDHSSPKWEWTLRPDFLGHYNFVYEVPRSALFGPYVVETTVQWDEGAGAETQSSHLYDYFEVANPDGDVPESPIYRLDLVSTYEDAR